VRLAALLLATGCGAATVGAPIEDAPASEVVAAEPIAREPADDRPRERVELAPPEFSAALTKGFADACGSCHDSRLRTAKPEALAIFDLADPQWLVGLPEARRACTLDRMAGNDAVTAAAKTDLARILEDLEAS
jgi:hypothetical protein